MKLSTQMRLLAVPIAAFGVASCWLWWSGVLPEVVLPLWLSALIALGGIGAFLVSTAIKRDEQ